MHSLSSGVLLCTVMSFELKNGLQEYSKVAHKTFEPYVTTFMKVFMDNFCIYGNHLDHLAHLCQCFLCCRMFHMSLNPFKCAIAYKCKKFLGNVVSTEGISLDANKIAAIQSIFAPLMLKALQ